jgi:transposase-like protein
VDSDELKEWRTFPTRNELATGLGGPGKGTPMLKVVAGGRSSQAGVPEIDEGRALDELAREGARQMIAAAMEVEVEEYLARHRGERGDDGRALVVRNGRAQARKLTVGAGTMTIEAPRVNDKRVLEGERQRFSSKILPPYLRRSPKVSEVLPLLYLHGLSTGDFREALPTLLGEDAAGLSPSAVTRLLGAWQEEYRRWRTRSFADRDYVYVWADGVHFNVRLEDERLAALVLVGARPDGTKEVIAIEDGYRESTDSWATVLRDLKRRGMQAPLLAIGDGALGFWAAVRDVWPETRDQLCWVHKIANVLDKLPKSIQPRAKQALHAMMYAETKAECQAEMEKFAEDYGAKHPKAVASLVDNRDRLLTFFDFPAEHWKHLRTTNPIESTFATVKLRQRVTKGAGSRAAGLAMAFKLMQSAQRTWRCLDAAQLLPLLRAGVRFVDGKQQERKKEPISKQQLQPRKVAA